MMISMIMTSRTCCNGCGHDINKCYVDINDDAYDDDLVIPMITMMTTMAMITMTKRITTMLLTMIMMITMTTMMMIMMMIIHSQILDNRSQ